VVGTALLVLLSGLLIGGLARWAVPGPDPMPLWLTAFIGLGGSVLGGGIAAAALGASKDVSRSDYFTIELASILAAILLVVAYRRLVQKRPITGPEAHRPPTRGFGLGRARPGSLRDTLRKAQLLRSLDDLHRSGLLTDEEYEEKRRRLLERP